MLKTLYRQFNFPVLQNRVYDTDEEAKNCSTGDIDIVEDLQTGLVYNRAFCFDLMNYDSNYNNEQGLSRYFFNHLEQVASIIESTLGRQNLVEVGCGKGFFLEMLLKKNIDITGFDPTYEGNNPRIVKKYFEPGIIKSANGLILRHILEHIQDPVEFLNQLKIANGGRGLIYIEVPCFDWICQNRAWFDIFYEHVNYFRLSDFKRMFGTLIKSGKFFGDQYIYIVANLETLQQPLFDKDDSIKFPVDFTNSISCIKDISTKHPICVWGAASKGVIFSFLTQKLGIDINYVIDINPAKQGKYLAATGLKVNSPESVINNQ